LINEGGENEGTNITYQETFSPGCWDVEKKYFSGHKKKSEGGSGNMGVTLTSKKGKKWEKKIGISAGAETIHKKKGGGTYSG